MYASFGDKIFITPLTDKKYSYLHDFKTHTNLGELTNLALTLGAGPDAVAPDVTATIIETMNDEEKGNLYRINRLKEVTITGSREDPIEPIKRAYRKVGDDYFLGSCGYDYGCPYYHKGEDFKRINCPQHFSGFRPFDGCYYFNPNPPLKYKNSGIVMYIGCPDTARGQYAAVDDATWYSREFYYADAATQAQPGYIPSSTVFWAHQIVTDENGEAELPYLTNDITGRYLIHLQGFTASGPISGKYYYRVTGD